MSIPSVKTIETAFKKWLQPGDAQKIRALMEGAGSNRSAEEALEAIDKIIGASGVETIRGGDNHGGFWQDAVLAYVNMGDPYVATVWYEPRYGMSGRWGVGGYGDWVEHWEREHGQLEGLSGKRGSYMRVPGKTGRGLGGLGVARDLNDNDREEWVNNDEGLYSWWKSTRQPIRTFVRENRARLTEMINAVRNKPPHEKSWRDFV